MTSILCKRPSAFRIPRADSATAGQTISKTEYRYFTDEAEAYKEAEALNIDYQALFVRDGTAIVAEWEPIETAPKEKDALFLVCAAGDDRGPFVVRSDILWQARKAGTPSHLGLIHLTHWMPLPAPPIHANQGAGR
jgi:hypothetical protein